MPNVLIRVKLKPKITKIMKNKFNNLPINNKYQEEDVHSWVDPKRKEILIFIKVTQALMSLSFQSSIIIFLPTK